jgi:4-hydroxybenzoate polyprenyltransferase
MIGEMKKKIVFAAIVIAVVVGLLAYYKYIPFWASIVSTGAFIAGIIAGWIAKKWSDKHIVDGK